MDKIHIPIKNNEYDVFVSEGLLQNIESHIDIHKEFVVITDENVDSLYIDIFKSKIRNLKVYVVTPGETSKSMETAYSLINSMIEDKVTRGATLISLGGGVVGDLGGFVASIFMRGINFIQIPTTLLSQIDSSVGGKVGINSKTMKNSIGSFFQPSKVLIDPSVLKTLSLKEFNNGISEMIKYGMIASKSLIKALQNGITVSTVKPHIITCINIKKTIVVEDTFDTGIRQILNYGHTIGHAIEQHSNYSLLHGEAVAIGMAMISKDTEHYNMLISLLQQYNLPVSYNYDIEDVYNYIQTDKKVTGETLNIILLESVGNALIKPISINEIRKFL